MVRLIDQLPVLSPNTSSLMANCKVPDGEPKRKKHAPVPTSMELVNPLPTLKRAINSQQVLPGAKYAFYAVHPDVPAGVLPGSLPAILISPVAVTATY